MSTYPASESEPRPAYEESAEEVYENAPCGYLSTAPDGRIVKVNETFLSWIGCSRDELILGKRFADLLTVGPGGAEMTPARDDDWGFLAPTAKK